MNHTATTANARPLAYLPPDAYDVSGTDGQGRNRLRLEVVTPAHRCPLLPLTYEAAWEARHRPEHSRLSWASFGACRGSSCETCPVFTARRERLYVATVAREDEEGRVWLMNRREGGWAEFGLPYAKWGALLGAWDVVVGSRGIDEHGTFFNINPSEGTN